MSSAYSGTDLRVVEVCDRSQPDLDIHPVDKWDSRANGSISFISPFTTSPRQTKPSKHEQICKDEEGPIVQLDRLA